MYKSQLKSKRIPELERAALKDVYVKHPQVQRRTFQNGAISTARLNAKRAHAPVPTRLKGLWSLSLSRLASELLS